MENQPQLSNRYLSLVKKSEVRYELVYDADVIRDGRKVLLGEVLQDVDGYFYFWPETERGGMWDACYLMWIGRAIHELNKGWDAEIGAYFDKQNEAVIDFQI